MKHTPLVLVIEDNAATRKLIAVALQSDGYHVTAAADGASALACAAECVPDLVIQDLVLPDLHGADVARRLREATARPALPIVAVTGLDPGPVDPTLFTCILRKPVPPSALLDTVRRIVPNGGPPLTAERRRVLVVDDTAAHLKLTRLQLEGTGFDVATAASAGEALALARDAPPDVILSDVLMPGTDGFDLCRAVRGDAALAHVPVVLISSAYTDASDRMLARDVGAYDLLSRSAAPQAMADALTAAIRTPPHPVAADAPSTRAHNERVRRQLETHAAHEAVLYRQLDVQAALISASAALAAAITGRVDIAEALRRALYAVADVSGIQHAAVCRLSHDGGALVPLAIDLDGTAALGDDPGVGDRLHECQTSGQPRTLAGPDAAALYADAQSAVLMPMDVAGAPTGVLVLGSSGTELDSDDWRAFAATLAVLVGQALLLDRMLTESMAFERRWRTLMDHATDGIALFDQSGRIVDANPAFASLAGRALSSIRGVHFADLLDGADVAAKAALFDSLVTTGSLPLTLVEATRADGHALLLEVAGATMEVGAETLAFVVLRDVTARAEAERALVRSEARYRALIEAAATFVWTADAGGRAVEPQPGLQAFTGLDFDALATIASDAVHPDDRTCVEEAWAAAVAGGTRVEGLEFRLRRHDGRWRDVRASAVPIRDASGAVVEWAGATTDITETKAMHQQVRQLQRLEAIGQLTGGVAHDFNNLMTAVLGFADLLRDELGPNEPAQESVDEIRRAAQSAGRLTRQLLAFTRQQPRETEVVDLGPLAASMERLFRRVIGEQIALEIATAPVYVLADRAQIEQVLMNLGINGRDAMPHGGTLRIETSAVRLDAGDPDAHGMLPAGAWARIVVRDTGCGMTDEVRTRAFEPFFTTKPRGYGTGLGLATVYGIVKQSDGFIFLDSEPGRGTTVTVYLPQVAPQPTDAPAPRAPRGARHTPKETRVVLLAEDEGAVRRITRAVLLREGYTVLDAASGPVALDLAERQAGPIHLLLTDVIMPGLTGPELAARLEARRPGIRTLYMSGYTGARLQGGPSELPPGARLLQKPFLPDALADMVRAALEEPDEGP